MSFNHPWIFGIGFSILAGIFFWNPAAAIAQDEAAAVEREMRAYSAAYATGEAAKVVEHLNEPYMVVSPNGAQSFATRNEIEGSISAFLRDLKSKGYTRSEFTELHVKLLAQNIAIVSAAAIRYAEGDKEMGRIGAIYLLTKKGEAWKVTVVTVTAPNNVLRLE
jgi:ketosteroid isomerase-like protein